MINDRRISGVRRRLAAWRRNKSGRTSRVPDDIRKEIIGLASRYSIGQVAASLNISGGMLKRWMDTSAVERNHATPEFVEIDRRTVECPPGKMSTRVIEIFRPDGLQLRICGEFSATELASVTGTLLEEVKKR